MVLIVQSPDMRRTVQHPDGTLIVTDQEGHVKYVFSSKYLVSQQMKKIEKKKVGGKGDGRIRR